MTALVMWVGGRAQAAYREANPGAPMSPFGPMPNDEAVRALQPVVEAVTTAMPLVLWLLTPLSVGVIAGAFHLAAKMFGGRAPFATTYRACLFLSPLWILTAPSPLCCGPVWFGWAGALMFHAFRRPHGLSDGGAFGALAVAALLLFGLSCALGGLVMCGGMAWVGPAALPR
jgi:hypothetical protein